MREKQSKSSENTKRKTNWFKGFFYCLFIMSIFTGCATVVHKPLDPTLTKDAINVHLISIIPQDSIKINIVESDKYFIGAGLLGIFVDEAINSNRALSAQELLTSFHKRTKDVDFKNMYWNKLEQAFSQSTKMLCNKFEKNCDYTIAEFKELDKPYLRFVTKYELSPSARTILVQTKAELYITESEEPDYYGYYVYFSNPIGIGKKLNIPQILELWLENDNAKYREILNEGIEQNMFMFKHDLLDRFNNCYSESSKKVRMLAFSPSSGYSTAYDGNLVLENDKRIIVREKGGNLFSIGKSLVSYLKIKD